MGTEEEEGEEVKNGINKIDPSIVEDLNRRLQLLGNGANVHTVNKAICYLNNFETQAIIIPYIKMALEKGEWDILKWRMAKWF